MQNEESPNTEPTQSEKDALSARDQEIIDQARSAKTNAAIARKSKKHGIIDKKKRAESLNRTIKRVQDELSPGRRLFSKFIHAKPVEAVSDFLAATIARPNAILAGSVVSFFLTLTVYVTAKKIGYDLSGFETIAAFILGWVIGVAYDYLRLLITGNK
jgi:hypothetical protein